MIIDRLEKSDDILKFRGKKLYTKYDFDSHVRYFKAHEVGSILGFNHIRDMKKYLDVYKIELREVYTDHGYQLMNMITEDGIYELICSMRKETGNKDSIADDFENFIWYELNVY